MVKADRHLQKSTLQTSLQLKTQWKAVIVTSHDVFVKV